MAVAAGEVTQVSSAALLPDAIHVSFADDTCTLRMALANRNPADMDVNEQFDVAGRGIAALFEVYLITLPPEESPKSTTY